MNIQITEVDNDVFFVQRDRKAFYKVVYKHGSYRVVNPLGEFMSRHNSIRLAISGAFALLIVRNEDF